jgi:hypothetical protein
VTNYADLCGALPSRDTTTSAYRMLRSFKPSAIAEIGRDEHIISGALDLRIRHQRTGSCVGEAIGGCIEQQTEHDPSGLSIWREAHRLQGIIEQITRGTRIEHGVAAVEDRGYSDPWRPGEDSDTEEMGLNATVAGDDLSDELAAFDTAHHTIEHSTIWGFGETLFRQMKLALAEDRGIVIATGLREPFFDLGHDQVATLKHVGGNANGHAMYLCGWRTNSLGATEWLLRNSWGPHWSGATVAGQFRPGLFWCSSEAISSFWEFHRILVVK